jgi:hypothetical protein
MSLVTCPDCGHEHTCTPPRFYTLTREDVGRAAIHAFGKTWLVSDFIGRILPGDVGKRVFRVQDPDRRIDILQVENDAGRALRERQYRLTTSSPTSQAHEHNYDGQTLRHSHPGGREPHGYFGHPEDGGQS